jgi:hypothetical protein
MITVKYILTTILFTGMIIVINVRQLKAQDHSSQTIQLLAASEINPEDPAFRAKYKDISFGGHFIIDVLSDEKNTYYIVDFSKLPSRFEKVYFMNLIFKKDKIVNIDSDITRQQVWFLAAKMFSVSSVEEMVNSVKADTDKANASFTDKEKENWLKENDKYGKEGPK